MPRLGVRSPLSPPLIPIAPAPVAQRIERQRPKLRVGGSSPSRGTTSLSITRTPNVKSGASYSCSRPICVLVCLQTSKALISLSRLTYIDSWDVGSWDCPWSVMVRQPRGWGYANVVFQLSTYVQMHRNVLYYVATVNRVLIASGWLRR